MHDLREASVNRQLRHQFAEQGYAGPVRVLSAQDCQQFLHTIRAAAQQPSPDWEKGHAVSSRTFYEIATHPAIMETVASLLGEDVMLWGASIQTRVPDAVHPWHNDIETSDTSAKAVSVWIGLDHTTTDSSLLVIPRSHRFDMTVQETAHRLGKRRGEISDDDVVRWALERDPKSRLVKLEMSDGEAVFLDGHLWHGSHNRSGKIRHALLLQYATPDTPIHIPDLNYLEWPFRRLITPRPACIMVKGKMDTNINRIVPAPVAPDTSSRPQLSSRIYPLCIPLPPDDEKGWKPYFIFNGTTTGMRALSCHVSVLTHNQCPHPPHRHDEEEILLVLSGEVEIVLPDIGGSDQDQHKCLTPGQLVYYPAHFAHTLRTVSTQPANYLMFKWVTGPSTEHSQLPFGLYDIFGHVRELADQEGFRTRLVFEGPTVCLQKLHCHVSTLAPGAGYDAHIDAHDVAIIVLEGQVETLGAHAGPHSVIFYPAGEPHGMLNPGDATARYVVFEFHGKQSSLTGATPISQASSIERQSLPRHWKRKLKDLLKRIVNSN